MCVRTSDQPAVVEQLLDVDVAQRGCQALLRREALMKTSASRSRIHSSMAAPSRPATPHSFG
jgi:hypothetical protein